MFFNIIPWIVTTLLIGVPFLLLSWSRKRFLWAAAISVSIVSLHFLSVYLPGRTLMVRANRGDAAAMYELARWTENHDEEIGEYFLWPVLPDVLGGYALLEKAADQDYLPAVYAIGVRLKYGEHVPRPPDWPRNKNGNYFPQPERGQALIDKAIRLGYRPLGDEKKFYWKEYRKRYG